MLIFIFNWVMYSCIIISVFRRLCSASKVTNTDLSYGQLAWTAAVLSVVFGLGWGFGLAQTSVPEDSSDAAKVTLFILQLLFALLVGSQGVLIFIFYGVGNKKVREVWKRWFLCGQHPKVFVNLSSRSAAPDSLKATRANTLSSNTYSTMNMQASVCEKGTMCKEKEQESNFAMTETGVEKNGDETKCFNSLDLTPDKMEELATKDKEELEKA